MGISSSSSNSDETGSGADAYHVLRVQHNSPAEKAGLQPFFDFITAVNGQPVTAPGSAKALQQHQQPIDLQLYSSKTRSSRWITILPISGWGGQGCVGASVRLCTLCGGEQPVWRVLSVQPGSPAECAGLLANVDFIVGADTPMEDYEDLCDLINDHNRKQLRLFVYNQSSDACRVVSLTPNANWGGEGCIGCGIGYGYLHRIPNCAKNSDQMSDKFFTPMDDCASDNNTANNNNNNNGKTSNKGFNINIPPAPAAAAAATAAAIAAADRVSALNRINNANATAEASADAEANADAEAEANASGDTVAV